MGNLSKNFNLNEFTYSTTAKKYKINNTPNTDVINNLKKLCVNVLQPIRDKFGILTITSGYRSNALNRAVGGAVNSNHLFGYAADIQTPHANLKDIYNFVVTNLNFDECLYEKNKQGVIWLHLAYREGQNRKKQNPNCKA